MKTIKLDVESTRRGKGHVFRDELMAEASTLAIADNDAVREYIGQLLDSMTVETAEAFQEMLFDLRGKNPATGEREPVDLKRKEAIASVMMKIGLSMDSLSRLRIAMQKTDPNALEAGRRTKVDIPATLSDGDWEEKYSTKFLKTLGPADKKHLT